MTPPSPKLAKILEGKAVFDPQAGWLIPDGGILMSPGYLARLLTEELKKHPEGFSRMLKLLPEGYFGEELDAYACIKYASLALEELPYLAPYSEEVEGLIGQAREKFCNDTETLPTRCYLGTEEWTALRECHAKNNLDFQSEGEPGQYPVFQDMQIYVVNEKHHLFVA